MKFDKQGLSKTDLARKVIERGLSGTSVSNLTDILNHISYFRLSGYWLQYKQEDETLRDSPHISLLMEIYCFDQTIRILILKSLQHIENTLRAMFIDHYATQFSDPFAYLTYFNFPEMTREEHAEKIKSMRQEAQRSQSLFVKAYKRKYDTPADLPVWMAIEVASFSTLIYLCIGSEIRFKKELGKVFNLPYKVLDTWLLCLRPIRNKCAHHERIWDLEFSRQMPLNPRPYKYPQWNSSIMPNRKTLFYRLLILEHMICNLPFADFSVFNELCKITETYPNVPLEKAGFPENWKSCPVWYD